jgi:hypothetical protein
MHAGAAVTETRKQCVSGGTMIANGAIIYIPEVTDYEVR